MGTKQVHKRLTTEQARTIFENYLSKDIPLEQALALFGVKRARFFVLLSEYRNDPSAFILAHKGNAGNRKISKESEDAILDELAKEKKLIDDKTLPVSHIARLPRFSKEVGQTTWPGYTYTGPCRNGQRFLYWKDGTGSGFINIKRHAPYTRHQRDIQGFQTPSFLR
ncbi:MAG: hypothetical protein WCL23_05325 [Candidatus Moraniibacteriota bacterium]